MVKVCLQAILSKTAEKNIYRDTTEEQLNFLSDFQVVKPHQMMKKHNFIAQI